MGWMTVLKLVPWTEVIKNAPGVADGAKSLWDSVGRKPGAVPDGVRGPDAAQRALEADAPLAAVLQARLDDADAAIATLHEQMQASSTLIKALADQNTELVARVELNRRRVLWLGAAVVGLAVVVLAGALMR